MTAAALYVLYSICISLFLFFALAPELRPLLYRISIFDLPISVIYVLFLLWIGIASRLSGHFYLRIMGCTSLLLFVSLLCTSPSSCSADRDIFPLCQDAVSEVGKPGYPGGLITRRAVSTFAKLQVAVSSNQPLATTFFK
jgi:O-antigen ligase